MNTKKIKKIREEYVKKQSMKPRDLVSVAEMAQAPQKVHKDHRNQLRTEELKLNKVISREVIQPRIAKTEDVIMANIRQISPSAPSHIF